MFHLQDSLPDEGVQVGVGRLAGQRDVHGGYLLWLAGRMLLGIQRPPHLQVRLTYNKGGQERVWVDTYVTLEIT